jgi:hypothetical protein
MPNDLFSHKLSKEQYDNFGELPDLVCRDKTQVERVLGSKALVKIKVFPSNS